MELLDPADVCDRLARCVCIGATKKGRTIVAFTGEPTAAEIEWEALKVPPPERR